MRSNYYSSSEVQNAQPQSRATDYFAAVFCRPFFNYGAQMAGKHVALIVSSHSSGISGVVADAERLVKNVTWMGDALWINASNHANRASLIQNWLPTLNFASGTNAIKSLTPCPSRGGEGSIYTLSGQHVVNPTHGIYIKNGKKVIL